MSHSQDLVECYETFMRVVTSSLAQAAETIVSQAEEYIRDDGIVDNMMRKHALFLVASHSLHLLAVEINKGAANSLGPNVDAHGTA